MTTRKVKHFIVGEKFNEPSDKPEVLTSKGYSFIIVVFEGGYDKATNTFTEDVRHFAPVPPKEVLDVLKSGVNYAYEPR
jgi:hypothetical protein